MPVTISFTFPDPYAPRLVEAFAVTYGYRPKVSNPDRTEGAPTEIVNPETAPEFARRKVAEFAKEVVTAYEIRKTRDQAASAAVEAVKQDLENVQVDITATQE